MTSWMTEDHGKELPEDVCRDLGLIQRRVRRMQQLLDDMLDYARAGRQDGDLTRSIPKSWCKRLSTCWGRPLGFRSVWGPCRRSSRIGLRCHKCCGT